MTKTAEHVVYFAAEVIHVTFSQTLGSCVVGENAITCFLEKQVLTKTTCGRPFTEFVKSASVLIAVLTFMCSNFR